MTLSTKDLTRLAMHRRATGSSEGFVPTEPKKKRRKNEEMVLHMACASWWGTACISFNIPEFLLWHTQNGIMHAGSKADRERIGGMMKRMAVRAGIPDFFLCVPHSMFHGLFVELKIPKGTLSDDQKIVLPELDRRGFQTAVCRSLEDFQLVVTKYITA